MNPLKILDPAALLAASTADDEYKETKNTRDKAYTLLKHAANEVRSFGQYVYWRNNSGKRGYTIRYLRQKSRRNAATQSDSADE